MFSLLLLVDVMYVAKFNIADPVLWYPETSPVSVLSNQLKC